LGTTPSQEKEREKQKLESCHGIPPFKCMQSSSGAILFLFVLQSWIFGARIL
jgi:hypothetical protein